MPRAALHRGDMRRGDGRLRSPPVKESVVIVLSVRSVAKKKAAIGEI